MEISGADARRVLELTRALKDAARPEELWGRTLTELLELVMTWTSSEIEPVRGSSSTPMNLPPVGMGVECGGDSVTLSDNQVGGPTAGRAESNACGGPRKTNSPRGAARAREAGTQGGAGYRRGPKSPAFGQARASKPGLPASGITEAPPPPHPCGGGECLHGVALDLIGGHTLGVATLDDTGRPRPLNAVAADLLAVLRDDPRLAEAVSFIARHIEVRYVPAVPALLLLRDLSRARAVARLFGITEQEHRTLVHLHNGRTATETARRMRLSPTTVRGYIASLHRKLEAGHTAALLRRGRDLGLLTD